MDFKGKKELQGVYKERERRCVGTKELMFERLIWCLERRNEKERRKTEREICIIRGVSYHFGPHCMLGATSIDAFIISIFLHFVCAYLYAI